MTDEVEIDLRKVFLTLKNGWKWIGASTLLVGVIAVAYAFLQPAKYESAATIAITRPRYLANFDPNYVTVSPNVLVSKAYLDLATSDEIIQQVFDAWTSPNKAKISLDTFRQETAVAAEGGDATIIYLTVKSKDPQEAARLSNFWAETFIQRANSIFGGQDDNQLTFFQGQKTVAQTELEAADKTLIDFASRDIRPVLKAQLADLLARQTETLSKQRSIHQAQDDARSLSLSLQSLSPTALVGQEDQLGWMVLRMRFYSQNIMVLQQGVTNPIQVQVPALSGQEPVQADQHLASIRGWIAALDDQLKSYQTMLDGLTQQITTLNQQIVTFDNEADHLKREHDVMSETFTTLSRKVEEISITSNSSQGDVRIAAKAVVNPLPIRSGRLVIILGGFLGGFLISALIIILRAWWIRLINLSGSEQSHP